MKITENYRMHLINFYVSALPLTSKYEELITTIMRQKLGTYYP